MEQESVLHEIEAELAIKQKYYLEAKEQLLKDPRLQALAIQFSKITL